MKLANANNSANPNAAKQVTQSWAHTVSDYLLQRRTQNKQAYETAFKAQSSLSVDSQRQESAAAIASEDTSDWLFKALFIALAQQLEEGHTVLTLSAAIVNDMSDNSSTSGTLYGWQRQLVTILLSPLSEYIDSTSIPAQDDLDPHQNLDQREVNNVSATLMTDPLNQLLTQWPQVAMQLALPLEENKVLTERHDLGKKLHRYFLDSTFSDSSFLETNFLYSELPTTNNSYLGKENSLSKFIEIIMENNLFSTTHTNEQTPIRFSQYREGDHLKLTLWLQRTWQAEYTLAEKIIEISTHKITPLPIIVNDELNLEQQAAIKLANSSAFSIITGGPGTGKTYTVAQLVVALKNTLAATNSTTKSANLALAAPTGKAAQRMQESLQAALDGVEVSVQLQEAKTIHRMLGIGHNGRPRYHADNPLSEDIIIVDEASMLGVELANHLVSAIKPGARLILLGDANQLAAVDAGAVLADLCRMPILQSKHQKLTESRRFGADSGIGKLAAQINNPKTDMSIIWQIVAKEDALVFHSIKAKNGDSISNNSNENSLSIYKLLKTITNLYKPYLLEIKKTGKRIDSAKSIPVTDNTTYASQLLLLLNQFRILTAGHHGRWGDHFLNRHLSEWHIRELKLPLSNSPWFHGRPVMVLQNSYELGLFNGDIGICLQTEKGLEVFFEQKQQGIAVSLFNDEMIATAYAMTIHKSQGSEFDHVAICFDDSNNRLLSQELIYTAVTRAKSQITIFSTETAFAYALDTPTVRQTGLSLQFSKFD